MKARSLMAMLATAFLLTATLYAADADKLEGVKCIVNPKKAAKADNGVAYKGAEVYFCCQGCPKKFQADSKPFATRANHQLVLTKQAKQVKCPLTGRALNENATVKVGNVKVTLCCNGCKGKVSKAEGAEQAELVFSDKAFEKGFEVKKEK